MGGPLVRTGWVSQSWWNWMSTSSPVLMIILPMRCSEFSLTKPGKSIKREQMVTRKTLQNTHQAKEEAANKPRTPDPWSSTLGLTLSSMSYWGMFILRVPSLLHLLIFQNAEYAAFLKSVIAQNLSTCSYIWRLEWHMAWHTVTNYI